MINIENVWLKEPIILVKSTNIWILKSNGPNSFSLVYMRCAFSIAQLCLTIYDPMEYNPQSSSVHGNLQARILEWVAIFYARESSWPRNRTCVSELNLCLLCLLHWHVDSFLLCQLEDPRNIKNVIIYILLNGGTIIELGISVLINKIQQRPKKH